MNKNPYSPHTEADRTAMLERIGVRSVDELFNAIPRDARSPRLGIGAGMSEQEVQAHLEKLAAMNKTAGSGPFFIGGPIPPRGNPPGPAPAPPARGLLHPVTPDPAGGGPGAP